MIDGASFATWWVDRYTRGLPDEVRDRRRAEIRSDVFDETAAGGAGGAVAWRTIRGVGDDVHWRRQEQRAMQTGAPVPDRSPVRSAWAIVTQNWFAPLAVLIGLFNLGGALTVLADDNSTMPGRVVGPVFMLGFAAAIFGGLWLRWRTGRELAVTAAPRPTRRAVPLRTMAGIAGVLAVALAGLVVGVSTGAAPWFFLSLFVVALPGVWFGVTSVSRVLATRDDAAKSGLANALVIVGTLPALAFFWMIVPPLAAMAVIGGALGTNPRIRPAA